MDARSGVCSTAGSLSCFARPPLARHSCTTSLTVLSNDSHARRSPSDFGSRIPDEVIAKVFQVSCEIVRFYVATEAFSLAGKGPISPRRSSR